ncbi:hypothetical protein [Streptomyces sp. NPDC059378]|uniref:hypothetical protein n=1 Tax=Streptomyces sp. NPDC059378 TaxID=3346815 RepID=UPI0036958C73
MDALRRTQLVMDVLRHAVNYDFVQATQVMNEIAAVSNVRQMFGVCCCFADAARQMLVRLYGHPSPECLWALAGPDPADGPRRPAQVFAQQFIAVYANGDLPTCRALYLAAAQGSAHDYARSLAALIRDVAHLVRVATQEMAADAESQPGTRADPATWPCPQ